jgi:hypothetical protein
MKRDVGHERPRHSHTMVNDGQALVTVFRNCRRDPSTHTRIAGQYQRTVTIAAATQVHARFERSQRFAIQSHQALATNSSAVARCL